MSRCELELHWDLLYTGIKLEIPADTLIIIQLQTGGLARRHEIYKIWSCSCLYSSWYLDQYNNACLLDLDDQDVQSDPIVMVIFKKPHPFRFSELLRNLEPDSSSLVHDSFLFHGSHTLWHNSVHFSRSFKLSVQRWTRYEPVPPQGQRLWTAGWGPAHDHHTQTAHKTIAF